MATLASYEISGAIVDGSMVDRTLQVGSFNGNLFVVAFWQLHSFSVPGDTGRNRLTVFKSSDGGQTWGQTIGAGLDFITEDGWFDVAPDGRYDDAHPYLHIVTSSPDRVWYYLRYNMSAESFDVVSPIASRRVLGFNRIYIGSNAHGESRALLQEGVIAELPDHSHAIDEPPKYFSINSDSGAIGGAVHLTPPGNNGDYFPNCILPAPAGGAHPEGDEGWFYMFAFQDFTLPGSPISSRWFDDGGAEYIFVDGTDDRVRAAVRTRLGAPEVFSLTLVPLSFGGGDMTSSTYVVDTLPNDGGGEFICDQSQIPATEIQGFHYTGGGAMIGKGETIYLLWMNGASIAMKQCSTAFADCSSFSAAEDLGDTGASIVAMLGGSPVAGGIGILFTQFEYPLEFDQWFTPRYAFVPTSSDLTIAGSAGIPSEEAFGKTHGVSGGGDVRSCGTLDRPHIQSGCDAPVLEDNHNDAHCTIETFGGFAF